MARVKLDGPQHQVEVEDESSSLAEVARTARKALRELVELAPIPEPRPGPAFGFIAERRPAVDLDPMDADGG